MDAKDFVKMFRDFCEKRGDDCTGCPLREYCCNPVMMCEYFDNIVQAIGNEQIC